MDHTEGIRPSARGCHIRCCRASLVLFPVSLVLFPVSVPKFKGINLRHDGRNSISVFTVLVVCLFVVVVVCIEGCGTLGVFTTVVWVYPTAVLGQYGCGDDVILQLVNIHIVYYY